jgi:hypothetical protein
MSNPDIKKHLELNLQWQLCLEQRHDIKSPTVHPNPLSGDSGDPMLSWRLPYSVVTENNMNLPIRMDLFQSLSSCHGALISSSFLVL